MRVQNSRFRRGENVKSMIGHTRRFAASASGGIAIGTLVLFVICWLFAPQSISPGAIRGMIPFVSVLILVAIGQTLVIQQGGIDLSVPGVISLAGVMTAMGWSNDGIPELAVLAAVAGMGIASGLVAGLLVTRLSVAPIVSTLGINTLLYGFNMAISGGTPAAAMPGLIAFANIRVMGVSVVLAIAVAATLIVAFVIKKTAVGRRFEFVGANARVGRAAGIPEANYKIAAYVASGFLSACAGALLAGIMQSPSAFQGDEYLMASIAAVVLGGTSLLGGSGNFLATTIAVVFLSQLRQFVLTTGAPVGVQFLFQGAAILIGVAVYLVDFRALFRRSPRRA